MSWGEVTRTVMAGQTQIMAGLFQIYSGSLLMGCGDVTRNVKNKQKDGSSSLLFLLSKAALFHVAQLTKLSRKLYSSSFVPVVTSSVSKPDDLKSVSNSEMLIKYI